MNFLYKPIDFERDFIEDFLIKEGEDLKKNIIFEKFLENDKNIEKLYNNSQISYVRNYISQTSLLKEPFFKLNELKINENSDISDAKELLITLNKDNEIIQDKIQKISLANLSRGKINFLFTKNFNIKKKISQVQGLPSNKNANIVKTNNDLKIGQSQEETQPIKQEENKEIKGNSCTEITYNYKIVKIKNCDCSGIKLNETFPETNKLKANSCQLCFDFSSENILRKLNEKDDSKKFKDFIFWNNLTELYLENCNLVNENFEELYFLISKNESLRSNLKLMSFKSNKITIVSTKDYFNTPSGNLQLVGLEFLDLSNNNINEILFSNLFNNLPNIKVLDFSNNNIYELRDIFKEEQENMSKEQPNKSDDQINKEKKSIEEFIIIEKEKPAGEKKDNSNKNLKKLIYLMAGNIIINKDDKLENYIKYLINTFPKNDYPLRSFNFSRLFYKEKFHNYLSKMDLLKYRDSLIEIDLSLCNSNDKEVSN